MVKIFNTRQKLEYAWDHVTLAMFLKYPNPFSVHVISADVIDRYVDSFGRLCTTRLIHKKGSIPNWVQYVCKCCFYFLIFCFDNDFYFFIFQFHFSFDFHFIYF